MDWVSCSLFPYTKSIRNHEKLCAVGKSGPTATCNLFFLGLGWPWVGEFVGFIIISICFLTQQNLVKRKHRINIVLRYYLIPGTYYRTPLRPETHGTSVLTFRDKGGSAQDNRHATGGFSKLLFLHNGESESLISYLYNSEG